MNDHEQVTLWFTDWRQAETIGRTRLGQAMVHARATGWWFVRKGPSWRIRYLPTPGQEEETRARLDRHLYFWKLEGHLTRWVRGIYEPETHAFGGPESMEHAHTLFHADSLHLMTHLRENGTRNRTLLAVLRSCALLRGAGQERHEQGDVFARLADHRPVDRGPTTAEVDQLDHLLRAHLPHPNMATGWTESFHHAGQDLAHLAETGHLTRGMRSVLAHHLLFAFNRAGVPAAEQGLIARAAADAVFYGTTARPVRPAFAMTDTTTVSRVNTINDSDTTRELRQSLVDSIRARGTFHTPAVEEAFAAVPRHLFLPEVDIETAYEPRVVVTKRDDDGEAISSASQPNLVAGMLEQLQASEGHRVLEIGAATGFNAALLTEIVGPTGQVTTVEIDDDLTDSARRHLEEAGYGQVEVVCGDGALGHPATAPFDRIIVTAGAWTIPTAWWEQLTPNGLMVVPVKLHGSGLTRSLPFARTGPDTLVATEALTCGFVPMRGSADAPVRTVPLGEGAVLKVAAEDQVDEQALSTALEHPPHTVWSGVTFRPFEQVVDHLDLWLATHDAHYGRLSVTKQLRDEGVSPTPRWAGASLHDGAGSIAYLVLRDIDGVVPETEELGVVAYGPDRVTIADHLTDLLRQWAKTMPAYPTITATPASTPESAMPEGVRVFKPDTTFTITW